MDQHIVNGRQFPTHRVFDNVRDFVSALANLVIDRSVPAIVR